MITDLDDFDGNDGTLDDEFDDYYDFYEGYDGSDEGNDGFNAYTKNKNKGRPRKDVRKSERVEVRLTPEELEELDEICAMDGKTRSEMIKCGLRMCKNLVKARY